MSFIGKHKKLIIALSAAIGLAVQTSSYAATFSYGEALQKSIFFYNIQRVGKINEATGIMANPVYWRGNSLIQDYALPNSEGNIDLGGGFADAGDNIKFNFPMAAATSVLAWGLVDFYDSYKQSGQLNNMLGVLHWATDYLLKSWDAKNGRLYGQVGQNSVGASHSNLWMPYEVLDQASIDKNLPRYGFYVDATHPGTDLAGEVVAALTASSMAFKATDPTYAAKLLSTAKAIYAAMVNVSNKGKYSDNMGRIVNGSWSLADVKSFYNSWSGYNDEIAWSSMWLYRATGDVSYIPVAEKYILFGNTASTQSWDDKSYGTYLLMAKFLPDTNPNKAKALASAQVWLNAWKNGTGNNSFSKQGLAINSALAPWGNARYAATTAFTGLIYDKYFNANSYNTFAKNQIDYLLGNNNNLFSYMCGYGSKFPKQPHHATAEGRWSGNNDVNYAGDNRHIAYGGLVGGPRDINDTYTDNRGDYVANEVALDYNAGFTGALAALYGQYGGAPLPATQFPPTAATEKPPANQFFVNGSVQSAQSSGSQSSIQVALLATNHSAWPARVTNNLKLRYFINISDKPAAAALPTIKTYSTDSRAVVTGPVLFDAAKGLYYIEVWFKNIPIYPGGDDRSISSKETQIQISYPWNHDVTKDWSYTGLGSSGSPKEAPNIPIYLVNSDGSSTLLFGKEPVNVPTGVLTLNFAANLPTQCSGAKDVISLSTGNAPGFTVGSTAFTYTMAQGGPYTATLGSTTTPISVTGGTCTGTLNSSQVSVPGSLTASYTFKTTPPVATGTLQVTSATSSDPKCSGLTDTLYLDGGTTGKTFTTQTGTSQTVNTGVHTLKLASQASIPVGTTGYCTSQLSATQLTVLQNQTTTATATYSYRAVTPGSLTCSITSAKVTQQSTWSSVVNQFAISVNLQGLPSSSSSTISGTFTMKNPFVQNFWGNFGMTSSSFNGNVGTFSGSIWPTQSPISFGGYIYNTTPMKVGDNPLQLMTINGVICQ